MPQLDCGRNREQRRDHPGMAAASEPARPHRQPSQRSTIRRTPSSNVAGSGSRLNHQVASAVEVEEIAGMHEQVVVLEQGDHQLFLGADCRHAQHRRPAARRPPALRARNGWRLRRAGRRNCGARVRGSASARTRPTLSSPARRAGPVWRRRDRCRRSARAAASIWRRAASGPSTASHPSLTCGNPADFDKPPSLKVRHSTGTANGGSEPPCSG